MADIKLGDNPDKVSTRCRRAELHRPAVRVRKLTRGNPVSEREHFLMTMHRRHALLGED